jgi:hypothetical protein
MIKNHLLQDNHYVVCDRLKETMLLVKSFTLPTVSMPPAKRVKSPKMVPANIVPSAIDYGEVISIEFIVDEELNNYTEILQWMFSINNAFSASESDSMDVETDDIVLHILTNNKTTQHKGFQFHQCFPTSLASFEFTNEGDGRTVITCSAEFSFTTFELL